MPAIPLADDARVLLGNPFSRSFEWANVRVLVNWLGGIRGWPLSRAESRNVLSATAYLYNPTKDESNPYDAISNTPGFESQIPPNKGFWVQVPPANTAPDIEYPRALGLLIPFQK